MSTSHPVPDEGASYDPIAVELKWQRRWQERRTNEPDLKAAASPFYQLMMFPYPSAEGLHVGNVFAFTGADIHGRFQRLQGNSVFEPMGFDAFGIHSENYALKTGGHPMRLIPQNIENFRRQLRRVGLMVDWKHELSTTDPTYYKWTQWIFLQLFKKGLAYKKTAAVNWCPNDKTVLANEQVETGLCERCGARVEQRLLEQWFFRITDYAERLLHNLEWIDWSESTKSAQRNWLGRSEGAEISFAIAGSDALPIVVFTTRPDTIFGATCSRPSIRRLVRSRRPSGAPRSRRIASGRRARMSCRAGWGRAPRKRERSPERTRSIRRRASAFPSGSQTTC